MSPCIKHCELPFPSLGLLAILGTDFFFFGRYRILGLQLQLGLRLGLKLGIRVRVSIRTMLGCKVSVSVEVRYSFRLG